MKALVALALVMFVTSALAFNNWYAVVIYDYDNKRAILGPFSSASECQQELRSVLYQFISVKQTACIQQR